MTTDVFAGTAAGSEPLIERLRRATIGRYDIYAELGSGGMASVFLALDLALDRKVAIKVMSPALTNSPDALERFKREAKTAAALSHPNIIAVYAVGDDPDLAYFVMKFIEGRSLDSVIRESGAQSVPFVQTIIANAGTALHYAHQRGVVHRDVKPANFMLDQDGWLVVTDFGIAKMDDGHGLTMSGTLIGTPYYMSPEQFNGQPVSGASDQYALGIVAFELLTGRTPYNGPTIAEVMRGHLIDEVPPIRSIRPEIPPALELCVSRMLAKSVAERYPTLADAVTAFGAVSPKVEAEVRTQIISLAKSGAAHQPRMSVPLSPIPQKRKTQAAEATQARRSGVGVGAGGAPAAVDPRGPTPRLAARPVPAPAPARRSALPWILSLLLVIGAGAGVAVLRPDLVGLAPKQSVSPIATAQPAPVPTQPDSAALAAAAAAAAALVPPPVAVVDTPKAPPAATKTPTKVPAKAKAPTKAPAKAVVEEPKSAAPEPAKAAVVEPAPVPVTPPPVRVETLVVVAPPAPTPPAPEPEPVPTGPGRVRIGTRLPFAVLSINDKVHGPIGSARGVLNLEVPSGPVRLTIKAENCVDWDTTVVVIPGQTTTVGVRAPRCQ